MRLHKASERSASGSSLRVGRKTGVVLLALTLAGCGSAQPSSNTKGNQQPAIQFEKQSPPPPIKQPPTLGKKVSEWVCEGFAVDGNRIVENFIVDGDSVFSRLDYTPKRVKRTAFNLETETSPNNENLRFYDKNGEPLAEGKNPTCFYTTLGIAAVKTNLHSPTGDKSFTTAYHVQPEALKADGTPTQPDYIYDVDTLNSCVKKTRNDLVAIEHFPIPSIDAAVAQIQAGQRCRG